MAKLTKAQQREITGMIRDMERAMAYVNQADIRIARVKRQATTTLDYTRPDGAVLTEVAKDIGSDICGLSFAIGKAHNFLENHR